MRDVPADRHDKQGTGISCVPTGIRIDGIDVQKPDRLEEGARAVVRSVLRRGRERFHREQGNAACSETPDDPCYQAPAEAVTMVIVIDADPRELGNPGGVMLYHGERDHIIVVPRKIYIGAVRDVAGQRSKVGESEIFRKVPRKAECPLRRDRIAVRVPCDGDIDTWRGYPGWKPNTLCAGLSVTLRASMISSANSRNAPCPPGRRQT